MVNDVSAANYGDGRGLASLFQVVEGPHTDTGGLAEVFNSIGKGA